MSLEFKLFVPIRQMLLRATSRACQDKVLRESQRSVRQVREQRIAANNAVMACDCRCGRKYSEQLQLFLIVFLVLGTGSCTLFHSRINEVIQMNEVPIAIQPLFASCSPSDGEVQLTIDGKDAHVSSINVVWNIPNERSWEMQFNTPMGDTRLALHRKNGVFSANGDIQLDIGTDQRGFMLINQHQLPLKDSELPCVLSGKWPVSWFQFLHKSNSTQGRLVLSGEDDVRDISIVTTYSNDGRGADSCSVIQWGGFLGMFKHSAELCIKRAPGAYQAELKAPAHYTAKWSQLRDEP